MDLEFHVFNVPLCLFVCFIRCIKSLFWHVLISREKSHIWYASSRRGFMLSLSLSLSLSHTHTHTHTHTHSLSLSREELGTRFVVTLFYNVVDRKRELCPGRNFGAHLKCFFFFFFFFTCGEQTVQSLFSPSHSLWFSSCP
jgi:hypothetical protein